MASNAPTRKTSNVLNSRINYKPLKIEVPNVPRVFQQPTIVSVNAKDANRDRDRDRDREERRKKSPALKSGNNSKSFNKRLEVVDSPRVTATASTPITTPSIPAPPMKSSANDRTVVLTRHAEVKQHRKPKLDSAISRPKSLRSAVAETLLTTSKPIKEAKSPDKVDAVPTRPVRTKNQAHNTKVFFDKYLKFAYDLSTPDGVRKLEAHFFPGESPKSKQMMKRNGLGDSSEKQPSGGN